MRKAMFAVLVCMLLVGSPAMAGVTTFTYTGTFGAGSADSTTGQGNAILGPPQSLANKPFSLSLTIDDTGVILTSPSSASNISNVKGTLSVNGVSVDLGGFISTYFSTSAACGWYVIYNGQKDSLNLDEAAIYIATETRPSSSTPWNASCEKDVPIAENVFSYISLRREIASDLSVATLSGVLLVSHVSVKSGNATPVAITPQPGMWWNPNEAGSGYVIEQAHGVLVVTVYSYKTNGDSEWYLAAGSIDNNNFIASLDKYRNGQCISCAYKAANTVGSDGTMTIELTSPTTGFMTLPGRGRFPIIKYVF